jgi:replicative DNA helicase
VSRPGTGPPEKIAPGGPSHPPGANVKAARPRNGTADFPEGTRGVGQSPEGAPANPPSDVAAEQIVLGSFMLGAELDDAGPLDAAWFYRPAHGIMYEAIAALDAQGLPRDPVAVLDELRRRGQLRVMRGDATYLHTCIAACPAPYMVWHYANIVRELSARRAVVEAGTRLAQAARDPACDVAAAADEAMAQIRLALGRIRDPGEVPW